MFRKTASNDIYNKIHTENIQKINPGSSYDRNTFSIAVVKNLESNKYILIDLLYLSLDESYQKYIKEQCTFYPEPYDNLPVVRLDILKSRIISKIEFRDKNFENNFDKTREYFEKFCENKCSYEENNYLENTLHFDDHLLTDWIVPSELDLRSMAMNIIMKSETGSWIVRRSSVIENLNVKIRVITLNKGSEICHYLVSHIDGFGYILTSSLSGEIFPKFGENRSITMYEVFSCLTNLLFYMTKEGLLLDKIVK